LKPWLVRTLAGKPGPQTANERCVGAGLARWSRDARAGLPSIAGLGLDREFRPKRGVALLGRMSVVGGLGLGVAGRRWGWLAEARSLGWWRRPVGRRSRGSFGVGGMAVGLGSCERGSLPDGHQLRLEGLVRSPSAPVTGSPFDGCGISGWWWSFSGHGTAWVGWHAAD